MLLRRYLRSTALHRHAYTVVVVVNSSTASRLVWEIQKQKCVFLGTKTIKESFYLKGESGWVNITCNCITLYTLQSDKSTRLSSQSPPIWPWAWPDGVVPAWAGCSRRPLWCPPTGTLLSRSQLQECSQGFKGLEMTQIFLVLHLETWRVTAGCLVFLSH